MKVNEIPHSVRKVANAHNDDKNGFVIYDHENDEYELIDATLAE